MRIPIPPTQDATTGHTPRQPRDPDAANSQAQPGRRERRGFTPLPNAVLFDARLSRDARLLYALLQAHARRDGSCFPSQATLAKELTAGETQVRAYLRELLCAGLISCHRRGQGRTNLYQLHVTIEEQSGSDPRTRAFPDMTVSADQPRSSRADLERPEPTRPASRAADCTPLEARKSGANEEHRDLDHSGVRIRRDHPPTGAPAAPPTPEIMDPSAPSLEGAVLELLPAGQPAATGACYDDEVYRGLVQPIATLRQELGDQAPLRSTVTRAYNLLRRSGLDSVRFLQLVEEARRITLDGRARITRRCAGMGEIRRPNMLPYCFAVLEGLLRENRPPVQQSGGFSEGETLTLTSAVEADVRRAPAGKLAADGDGPDALWCAVLKQLQGVLAPAVYARCRASGTATSQGDVLRVAVPDSSTRHWFDSRLRRLIEEALHACAPTMRVEFIVDHSPGHELPAIATDGKRSEGGARTPTKGAYGCQKEIADDGAESCKTHDGRQAGDMHTLVTDHDWHRATDGDEREAQQRRTAAARITDVHLTDKEPARHTRPTAPGASFVSPRSGAEPSCAGLSKILLEVSEQPASPRR